jgi:hypothetical protein
MLAYRIYMRGNISYMKKGLLCAVIFSAVLMDRCFVFPAVDDNNEMHEPLRQAEDFSGYYAAASDDMTVCDREILLLAQEAACTLGRLLEKAVNDGIKTEDEIFSTLYFPISPETYPPTFHTFYDDYTDMVIRPAEDEYLNRDKRLLYIAMVDRNGYVPSHNSIFSKPTTGDHHRDYHYHRSKRIFNDMAGLSAARNTKPFLLQNYPRDTGEIITDLSVPIIVFGRHWGAVRCGYKVEE